MNEVALVADAGRTTGSPAARRLRSTGKVPAVLYGHGIDPVALAVDARQLRGALTTEAGVNALISLEVSGTRHLAMTRQLQRHPVRGDVTHVDFVVVGRDEVVSAEVPVHLVGEAELVHRADGILDQSLFTLPISAKPGDIPGSVEVDVSGLTIGDAVRVGELKLPEGVTTDLDPEDTVVVAQGPQAIDLGEAAAAEAAEAVEGVEAAEGAEGGETGDEEASSGSGGEA